MIKYYCDKCGEETVSPTKLLSDKNEVKYTATEITFGGKVCFHLCDSCYEKFIAWLRNRE